VGTIPPNDITSADFTILNDKFSEDAAADGLTGSNLDFGTAYLIADLVESRTENSKFISEKIGDYSYKKSSHYDDGVSFWMQKYSNLLMVKTAVAPSSVATRKDADMQAVNIDQNTIHKFYEV